MASPSQGTLQQLLESIVERVARCFEREGLLVRDEQHASLTLPESDVFDQVLQCSTTYRLAFGPHAGRKALVLRTVPAVETSASSTLLAKHVGFSLHAATVCEAHQRDKLERLCRYVCRPAVATERLELNDHGQVVYQLKTPWRDGTTHMVFHPIDFLARLAALVPRPRINLTRFHGLFAPNCKQRHLVVPRTRALNCVQPTTQPTYAGMSWAQRLRRVFQIDVISCQHCGGRLRVIACIDQPDVVRRILTSMGYCNPRHNSAEPSARGARAPPRTTLPLLTTAN